MRATFAERLGWARGSRVVLFHTDDAGLCTASNAGAIEACERGLARSFSVMMPCPGAGEIAAYCRAQPGVDAGVHLVLTSEFRRFRWRPLSNLGEVPGLVDSEGCFHASSAKVAAGASAAEVERELRAQVAAARDAGIPVTHLDCHMGAVFLRPDFFACYVRLGRELGVPVLAAGGAPTPGMWMQRAVKAAGARLFGLPRFDFPRLTETSVESAWAAGMPVVDYIHADAYGWPPAEKTARLAALTRRLVPGVTVVLLHCARGADGLDQLEGTGASRVADTDAAVSPELRDDVEQAGVHCTTWRELWARRHAA